MHAMIFGRGRRRSRDGQDGQSMTEFALISPVLFILLFGVIQFGFLFAGQIALNNAVRETARYAVTIGNALPASVRTELISRQLPKAIPGFRSANVVAGSTTVSYCYYTNPNNTGSFPSYSLKVIVTATYRHPLFIPLVGNLVDGTDGTSDGTLTATAREEMRVESLRLTSIPSGGSPCP
jgi:Flp pilus assembly protein TadG